MFSLVLFSSAPVFITHSSDIEENTTHVVLINSNTNDLKLKRRPSPCALAKTQCISKLSQEAMPYSRDNILLLELGNYRVNQICLYSPSDQWQINSCLFPLINSLSASAKIVWILVIPFRQESWVDDWVYRL